MRVVLLVIIGAVVMLLGVVLFQTATVTSRQIAVEPVTPIFVDANQSAQRLASAIRYKTISHQNPTERDGSEFLRFHQYLEQAYPHVHRTLTREIVNDYSLLYTWNGSSKELNPVVLMAHMDVVPAADEEDGDWTYPPFEGRIADGYVWGRGSMDVKLTLTASLEAIEMLIEQGFQPRRTVYLAFGHDEEIGGREGAAKIANLLEKREVKVAFTLDEGSAIVNDFVPGVMKPVALVGLAEKGYLTLMLAATGEGGHSARPVHPSTVGRLAGAIHRLEANLMPTGLRKPAAGIFEHLASEMPFGMRAVVSNRWLFEPMLVSRLERLPATNAMVRTTTAPTLLFKSGTKENVIPRQAKAIVNFRILPGDSIQGVIDHVVRTIDDESVEVTRYGHGREPSPVSNPESSDFQALCKTIRQVFPDTVVAPSLVIGGTDSKHYEKIAENSFRFIPMRLEKEDLKRIHGNDERISIENYIEVIRFYVQLLRNTVAE